MAGSSEEDGERVSRGSDADWMERALDQAREAASREEVPVGAVLVTAGGEVFADHNRTRERNDPTAHAEILVIRAAADRAGDWRLVGSTLFVTLEPCAMCAGAAVLARLDRLVFGADDPKGGMCGSLENLVQDDRLNHRMEVSRGLRSEDSARLLRGFFRERREKE